MNAAGEVVGGGNAIRQADEQREEVSLCVVGSGWVVREQLNQAD